MIRTLRTHLAGLAAAGLFLLPISVFAEEAQVVSVQLNQAQSQGEACQLTFVLKNNLGTEIDPLVLETVLFSTTGEVILLTLFDFSALPQDLPRVRQFAVPGATCDQIESLLINGVQSCGAHEVSTCAKALRTNSRTSIKVLG